MRVISVEVKSFLLVLALASLFGAAGCGPSEKEKEEEQKIETTQKQQEYIKKAIEILRSDFILDDSAISGQRVSQNSRIADRLAKLGPTAKEAMPALIQVFEEDKIYATDFLKAMDRIDPKNEDAAELIIIKLREWGWFKNSHIIGDYNRVLLAIRLLGESGDKRAIPLLTEMLEYNPHFAVRSEYKSEFHERLRAAINLLGSSAVYESNLNRDLMREVTIFEGSHDTVRELLDRGADVNARDKNELKNEMTPLMHAAANLKPNLDIVNILIDSGANVNDRDKTGMTALMHAAKIGNLDIVKILLDRAANVNDKDNTKMTALMYAADLVKGGDIVRFLLDRGANVNAVDDLGRTALDHAQELQEYLSNMSKGVLTNVEGQNKKTDVIEILLKAGISGMSGTSSN